MGDRAAGSRPGGSRGDAGPWICPSASCSQPGAASLWNMLFSMPSHWASLCPHCPASAGCLDPDAPALQGGSPAWGPATSQPPPHRAWCGRSCNTSQSWAWRKSQMQIQAQLCISEPSPSSVKRGEDPSFEERNFPARGNPMCRALRAAPASLSRPRPTSP